MEMTTTTMIPKPTMEISVSEEAGAKSLVLPRNAKPPHHHESPNLLRMVARNYAEQVQTMMFWIEKRFEDKYKIEECQL